MNKVAAYDLTDTERIIRGRMPGFEAIADRFLRLLRTWLLHQQGSGIFESRATVSRVRFQDAMRVIVAPAHLFPFRLVPLPGTSLLSLSPAFAHTLIEHAFGGQPKRRSSAKPGKQKKPLPARTQEASPIEQRLLARVGGELLQLFQQACQPEIPFTPECIGYERNPLALGGTTPSEPLIRVEIAIGEDPAAVSICIPAYSLSRFREVLNRGTHAAVSDATSERQRTAAEQIANHLLQVSVELRAVLGTAEMKYGDILALRAGDFVPLNTVSPSPSPSPETPRAAVLIEGIPRFVGTVGSAGGHHVVVVETDPAKKRSP